MNDEILQALKDGNTLLAQILQNNQRILVESEKIDMKVGLIQQGFNQLKNIGLPLLQKEANK